MKGTTNSKLTSSLKEIVNVNLSTNQNDSSDLIGAIVTVEYGGEFKNFVWNGELLNVEVPEGFDYTVSVGEVDNYKAPSPVSYSAEGNSFTSIDLQYLTEIVYVDLSTEDGSSCVGYTITINGIEHIYNGESITLKIAYGATCTIVPNDREDGYKADSQTFLALLKTRNVIIEYWLGLPKGTTIEFDYTGSVQLASLPKGKYKLQCWGAQGGNVTGTYAATGSKGGYAEGVLSVNESTTLYAFVGGKSADYGSTIQSSETIINGGWNGGGNGVRFSAHDRSFLNLMITHCFQRGGGGATDFSTVTSSMSYSGGSTNRSSASLLARCIVAGGGAGAGSAYRYIGDYNTELLVTSTTLTNYTYDEAKSVYIFKWVLPSFTDLNEIRLIDSNGNAAKRFVMNVTNKLGKKYDHTYYYGNTFVRENTNKITVEFESSTSSALTVYYYESLFMGYVAGFSNKTDGKDYGGGTSGGGKYPGTQSGVYSGGDFDFTYGGFGYGANASYTYLGYAGPGGGGGGWYGGSLTHDFNVSNEATLDVTGGGSGFVNIASNAKYRPEGYTGLQLESGQTIAGNKSFESPTGGTETGHSGNGYARITVL